MSPPGRSMRVLFTSISGLGHVHPMVPLALAMLERGHEVRWLTGPDACDRLRAVGVDASDVGVPFEDLRAEYRHRYPEAAALPPERIADHVFPHLFGEIAPPHVVADVIRITRDWKPDLLIHEAAEFVGPIAAALTGARSVTFGFGALTPVLRVEQAAELAAPAWRSVGLEPRAYGGLYDGLYLDPYATSLQVADMRHVPRRQLIRSVAFDDAGDRPVIDLDRGPGADPLVYLTFGTVHRDDRRLRVALEAIAAHPIRVLVTVGPTGDPGALGPQPDHVRVERYVPQTQVLRHCAAVVSHAGSGTFLATIANGIPQLCLPQAADQFLNAEACVRSGAGLTLIPVDASVTAIGEALARLLTERSFRDRAEDVAAEIAAMPSPGEVARILEGPSIPA